MSIQSRPGCAAASSGAAVASKRSSVVPAPCAARCRARVAAKFPLCPRRAVPCTAPRSALVPSVLHATGRHDGRHFLSRAFSAPQTPSGRLPADMLLGRARPLLARARPSAAVRSVTPVAPHGALHTSLRGRSAAEEGGRSLPLSIGQQRPARAPRGSLRNAAPASCADPTRRQQPRRRSSGRPRGAGRALLRSRPKALRRPPYRAHWPGSGRSSRYRASLCPSPPNARAGAKYIHPRRSQRTKRAQSAR